MKRNLLGSTAIVFAAAVVGALAATPAAAENWSGVYLGAHVGAAWGSTTVTIPAYPSKFDITSTSAIYGGQVGINWTIDDWLVVGLEGDGSLMNENGSHLSGGGGGEHYFSRYDSRYSFRGRVGFSYDDDFLIYVTGGMAGSDLARANFLPFAGADKDDKLVGWTAGAGVEYAWTPNWIIGAEYLHDGYGHDHFVYGGPVTQVYTNDMVRFRISYKLGDEAPPPPPPPLPPPPPPPPPPVMPVKTFIVFFDFDKSNLTDKAQEIVAEAVRTAKSTGMVRVLVTGHTDTVGSDSYNQALSIRRAESVKDEMVREGLGGDGISIVGKSFHDPLVPTGPGVREPQNRRAVIDLGG